MKKKVLLRWNVLALVKDLIPLDDDQPILSIDRPGDDEGNRKPNEP